MRYFQTSGNTELTQLREKLIAGKNEQVGGLQKFRQAQFYENLTKEQYTGVVPRKLNIFSASRDTMNPYLNTQRLKNRLEAIEHYRHKHGQLYARWPHFAMQRLGNHLFRYKVNYGIKAFAAYLAYQEYAEYRHLSQMTIMTHDSELAHYIRLGGKTAAFGALVMLI